MANHKSSEKRIRQTATKREHNRYYAKTTRNAVKRLRMVTDRAVAKKNIIHDNKAANLKSKLALHVNKL